MASTSGSAPAPGFGHQLRRLREAQGLTQEQLAERSGLTPHAISALERGERRHPYPHTVQALVAALDLDEDTRATLVGAIPRRAATTTATRPVSLPRVPPTPLVGRVADLAAIGRLLMQYEVRLMTLLGPGGVGKTRLAQQTAIDYGDQYVDGVAWVDLAALTNIALVFPTIAAAMDMREAAGQAPHHSVQTYLRAKRMLLVLDNFEQVAAAAVEVAALLGACPQLTVLVTSRAPLHIRGEREYPVAPLAVPTLHEAPLLEQVRASPAVQLFAERAQAVAPTFTLTQANAATVAAICRRLDGMPLALELAAVWIKMLSPTALLTRLDRVLPLLVGGAQDLPVRQQTLRQTVAWSYDLLSAAEQQVFRRLAVFAGSWTLDAAAAVCLPYPDDATILEGLQRLLDQNLIVATGEEERWRLLEPIKEYAWEKLAASAEMEQMHERHATYYTDLATRIKPNLTRSDQVAQLDLLQREHDNLRAALAWLLEQERHEQAARIGWGIWSFWAARGHLGEGREWMERIRASDTARPALSTGAQARVLIVIALLAFYQGDVARTVTSVDEVMRLARASGDQATFAQALLLWGLAALSGGDSETATTVLGQARDVCRALGDDNGVAQALSGLAKAAMDRGDDESASDLLAEAETVARGAEDWASLTTILGVQALVAILRGDEVVAETLLRECVAFAGTLRDAWTVVIGIRWLAGAIARRGQPERAARLFGAANALAERSGVVIAWPDWQKPYERDLAFVRESLDAATFAFAEGIGRSMTLEETISEALAEH